MAKHRTAVSDATPWYKQPLLLGGIIGIVIIIVFFFLVNAVLSSDKPATQAGAESGNLGVAAQMEGGQQVIRMAVRGYEYSPDAFTVQQNIPVKFIIDGSQVSGCTSIIQSRDFGFNTRLTKGENVIEFTPTQKGTFRFACGMNMVQGTITVV